MNKSPFRDGRATYLPHDLIDVVVQYIGTHAYSVYMVLARHAGTDGTCQLSSAAIVATTGMSRTQVFRSLERLEECGLVRRTKRMDENKGQVSNSYAILPIALSSPLGGKDAA